MTLLRQGSSQRTVARRMGVSLRTVQHWAQRARDLDLDQVDWSDHRSLARKPANQTPREIEDLILRTRRELREESILGEFGAQAIRRELLARQVESVPAARTIGRILEQRGALDGRRRIRHKAPKRGWYLLDLADGQAEMDQIDYVEGLVIQGGTDVLVLNVVALHSHLVGSWPRAKMTARIVREALIEHWREFGLPTYAQFDNDTCFQGPHQHPDALGSVIRLCLALGVVPVFAPPRETGFQAAIEAYNGLWQSKVWARFHHESLAALQAHSSKYVAAHRHRTAPRLDTAPERRPFPNPWALNLQAKPRGRIIFIRRTSGQGKVDLLGRTLTVADTWLHRLVRAEVDLDQGIIRFFALRRKEPDQQKLLAETPYALPNRRFRE